MTDASGGPWSETHFYESVKLQARTVIKGLLWGCRLEKLRDATLIRCCLGHSRVEPRRVEDLLGLTVTLDCFTWGDLELNELAMDTMLYLLSTGKGNDEKREVLKRMIRPEHLLELEAAFARLESL